MSFLKRIQSKSSAMKAQYAFGISGLVTGIIAMVWMSTIPAQFAAITPPEAENVAEEDGQSFAELLNGAQDQLGNVIEAAKPPEEIQALTGETANLDSLNMYEAPAPDTTLETPAPNYAAPGIVESPSNAVPDVVMREEPKETPQTGPKIILIGTTTSSQ